jgi:two-component sensor histidine kinase
MIELTSSYIATDQMDEARGQIRKINALLSENNWPEQKLAYWKLKAELCEALGDIDMAIQASKKYIQLKDSLDKEERKELLKNLKAIYSIGLDQSKDREESKAIKALNKELQTTQWTLSLTLSLIVLLLAMLFILYRSFSKTRTETADSTTLTTQLSDQSAAIEKVLKEKDMLLREVHHRVKNNLQIISSLFFLQSKHIKDEVALGLIKEGQSRIHVMSLIHQKLYQAEELNHIDFQGYFSDLAKQILQMHQSKDVEIDVIIEAREISESMELAVPLGMIVNELLTNSIKHAFTGRRIGHIQIGLIKQHGRMKLVYEDDGRGLSENNDFINGDSLGMKLIRLLTNQLGGNLEFGPTLGFSLSIEFDHK